MVGRVGRDGSDGCGHPLQKIDLIRRELSQPEEHAALDRAQGISGSQKSTINLSNLLLRQDILGSIIAAHGPYQIGCEYLTCT